MRLNLILLSAIVAVLLACGDRETTHRVEVTNTAAPGPSASPAANRVAVSVPSSGQETSAEELERQRFDERWRSLLSFRSAQQPAAGGTSPAPGNPDLKFAKGKFAETLETIDASTINQLPVQVPIKGDVAGPSVLKAQVMLDRGRFSPGIIDGRWGKNSEIALYWFQKEHGLSPTGEVDENTYRALDGAAGNESVVSSHSLTSDDLKGPFIKLPDDVYQKAKLDCLCYESQTEKLAELFHVTPDLLGRLNPGVDLNGLRAGQSIMVPNVRQPVTTDAPAGFSKLVVSVEGNYLHAIRPDGSVAFHAPTTVGSQYDPSPDETVKLVGIAFDPEFHYQPTLFHDVPDSDEEAMLPPGPNSPVGVVWMELSKPHYGIHGTSAPETIGYASSHGCIRLTNWDADDLAHWVKGGIAVQFTDARSSAQGSGPGAQ